MRPPSPTSHFLFVSSSLFHVSHGFFLFFGFFSYSLATIDHGHPLYSICPFSPADLNLRSLSLSCINPQFRRATTAASPRKRKGKRKMSEDDKPDAAGGRGTALCTCIAIFLLLAGITALTVWLVYRPHKPQFTVAGAAIYNLNATTSLPPFISTSMQFTIVTRNPNHRVSIFYDKLSAFVSYRNQAITQPVILPPLFHEKHSTVALSPILGGGGPPVPVSVEVANGLVMDEAYGVVGFRLVLLGKLRWKAGAIRTGRYGIYVKCDVLLGFKKGFVGQVPLLQSPQCKVDI